MSSVTVWTDSLKLLSVDWHKQALPTVSFDFVALPDGTRSSQTRSFPDVDAALKWAVKEVKTRHADHVTTLVSKMQVGETIHIEPLHLVVVRSGADYLLGCPYEKNGRDGIQEIARRPSFEELSKLVGFISKTAEKGKLELMEMVENGELPSNITDFGDLHDHFDANFLVAATFMKKQQKKGEIGFGVADQDEAWCGAANAAQDTIDDWLKTNPLPAFDTSWVNEHVAKTSPVPTFTP
jgi:hypothetical protein